jgi:[lysine-biosynthesis-protein LysW]--L-2-aminoadipate ligase
MKVGVLCSRVRVEEKLLFAAFEALGVVPQRLDEREIAARIGDYAPDLDIVLERSVSTSAGLMAVQLFEAAGIRTVNTYRTGSICADKVRTTLTLNTSATRQC